ncbi:hypothetical protein PAXRUDRAFT_153919, partial [Paxillus rubicundulus Ve08.2h10]
ISQKARLTSVVRCLHSNGLSVATFICEILWSNDPSHAVAQATLTENVTQICEELRNHKDSHSSINSWVSTVSHKEFCREIAELTLEKHGLHFKATSATTEQLEESFVDRLAMYDYYFLN